MNSADQSLSVSRVWQNPITGILSSFSTYWKPKKPYQEFMARLAESGRPVKEVVAEVVGLSVGSSVNYAQALAQVVDFYLDPARARELAEIKVLITKTDAQSAERLRGYVREAQSAYWVYLKWIVWRELTSDGLR